MKKGYWIATYQKILDGRKLEEYVTLAGPAIKEGGGRMLVRGMPAATFEDGLSERTVVIEFDSVDTAIKTHNSSSYKKALKALNGGAVRDLRIVEGTD